MPEALPRYAVRVLILDPDDHVLLQLIRAQSGDEWWITPGGAIEEGESLHEAALRELVEEIGFNDAVLGPEIWTRRDRFEWAGTTYDQHERFLFCRAPTRFEAAPTIAPEQIASEGISGHRWWSLDELESSSVQLAPSRLCALIRQLLADGPPEVAFDAGV